MPSTYQDLELGWVRAQRQIDQLFSRKQKAPTRGLGNKYKDLYEFIPHSHEMMLLCFVHSSCAYFSLACVTGVRREEKGKPPGERDGRSTSSFSRRFSVPFPFERLPRRLIFLVYFEKICPLLWVFPLTLTHPRNNHAVLR